MLDVSILYIVIISIVVVRVRLVLINERSHDGLAHVLELFFFVFIESLGRALPLVIDVVGADLVVLLLRATATRLR